MHRRTKAKLEWMAWGTLYAFLFPFLSMWLLFGLNVLEALAASLATCVVGGPCMSLVFLFLVPHTRRYPFAVAMAMQIGALSAVIYFGFFLSTAIIGSLKAQVFFLEPHVLSQAAQFYKIEGMKTALLVAAGMMLAMTFGGAIAAKLGSGVLFSWVTGKYHRPREETRIFMFLDVKDSTPLAERLGNLKFSELIQWFFRDLSESLAEHRGAVSHYVGDEAVIYWTPKKGLDRAHCVRFFFDLRETIRERAPAYERRFGVVPEFKAGLHIGSVVAAEVGAGKSEIALYGDAVNTTARIVGKCAELGADLLISGDLVAALAQSPHPFSMVSLGAQSLKGKSETVEVFAVAP